MQKYLDHLPLERQVRIMKREGLDVTSQTMWDYLERLVRLLEPAHARLGKYQLTVPVVGADETRWRDGRSTGGANEVARLGARLREGGVLRDSREPFG